MVSFIDMLSSKDRMSLSKVLVIVLVSFFLGFFGQRLFKSNTDNSGWHPVYKTDTDGTVLYGSTEELIKFLRKGYDLRLAWGWKQKDKSIEHLADPIWIAIINEKEVIVHLDPQVLSRIDWEEQSANYIDSTLFEYEWRVVISTTGSFDAVWYNRVTNKVHRRLPQQHPTTWMIDFPKKGRDTESKPIFSTE